MLIETLQVKTDLQGNHKFKIKISEVNKEYVFKCDRTSADCPVQGMFNADHRLMETFIVVIRTRGDCLVTVLTKTCRECY